MAVSSEPAVELPRCSLEPLTRDTSHEIESVVRPLYFLNYAPGYHPPSTASGFSWGGLSSLIGQPKSPADQSLSALWAGARGGGRFSYYYEVFRPDLDDDRRIEGPLAVGEITLITY